MTASLSQPLCRKKSWVAFIKDTLASLSVVRAASSVWWPGISKDISDLIGKCRVCQEKQSSQTREPLLPSPLSQRPFQQMAAELCEHNGRHYLVVVDYYSRYLDICFLSKTTSQAIIGHLKKIFARHGIPETLVSDNGPQFSSSEFKAFSDFWNFQHVTTSPHFPQLTVPWNVLFELQNTFSTKMMCFWHCSYTEHLPSLN